jgi:multiple sugar transport system substrate-binding protein
VLLLGLLLLPLAGCAGTPAGAEGRVLIRYAHWGGAHEIAVWEALQQRFHERQDRIYVKLEHVAGVAYHPKLMAMTVGRNAPDAMAIDDELFPELAENGLFADLAPWIARDAEIDVDAYYPQFAEAWLHKGKTYGLPYLGHVLMIYYNRAHLRAAGLPEPAEDWDWDEFLRYARALTRDLDGNGRTDRFGFMRPFSLPYSLPWIWSFGGDELNEEMTHCTLNTPEALEGIRFAYDLIHTHRVTPLMTELPNMPLENMFLTGQLSMLVHGPWWLNNCRREPTLEWNVQHMPRGPKGRATRATSEAVGISSQSEHQDEAWEWIRFICGEEGQEIIARFEQGIPANREIAERRFVKPDSRQDEHRFLAAMEYARTQILPVEFAACFTVVTEEWDLMLMGKRTAEQVGANLERRLNRILERSRARRQAREAAL